LKIADRIVALEYAATQPSESCVEQALSVARLINDCHTNDDFEAMVDPILSTCHKLYSQGSFALAQPLAAALNNQRSRLSNVRIQRRVATMAGILAMNTGNHATALEMHADAFDLAARVGTADELTGSLNNIGSAWLHAGCYSEASEAYRDALFASDKRGGPLQSRVSALTNIAQCELYRGHIAEGLHYAELAQHALTENPTQQFGGVGEVFLKRNHIRLLVEDNQLDKARSMIAPTLAIARGSGSKRALVAAAVSEGIVDAAFGYKDIARTRLDAALHESRLSWADLRDTLTVVIRAEELLGSPARALARLTELSSILHYKTVDVNSGEIKARPTDVELTLALRRRLSSKVPASDVPEIWQSLIRIAVGNSLQFDITGKHGHRVGTLSTMLARSIGMHPLQALEIGHAAKLHDVGLAVGHEKLLSTHPDHRHFGSPELEGHVLAGRSMLSDDTHPRMLLAQDIARYHHAAWDGSGCPVGLAGEAIPLHARICAVSDTFDGLMHTRLTVGDTSMGEALTALKRLAGTLLDPKLVTLFCGRIRENASAYSNGDDDGMGNFFSLVETMAARRLIF
jgi:putative two-component system response regulator